MFLPSSRPRALLFILAILLAGDRAAAGTKYTIPIAVFSYDYHPGEAREAYAEGDLGIIAPTYARSYLYVAYRWMDGPELSGEEQREIQKIWFRSPEASSNEADAWRDLRSSIGVPYPNIALSSGPLAHRQGPQYRQYLPCTLHSFGRATERLREHVDRFGSESGEVREWAQAQDMVFENCYRHSDFLTPPAVPTGLHPDIVADRRYQQAAALFISNRLEAAEAGFREIEPDAESWAGLWAPYMVGRSILWQARLFADVDSDEPQYRELLRKARSAFEAVLRNDELAETHNAARYLLLRILALTDPEAAARLLGLRLTSPLRAESRLQDLRQYLTLLDYNTEQRVGYTTIMQPHSRLRRLGRRDSLTDWILAFQSRDPQAFHYSLERWRQTGSTTWLVACLEKAPADDGAVGVLLKAAAEQPFGPGWPSVQYYRARLLAAIGEREQARLTLDHLLPKLTARASSWKRALALRAQLGRTPAETLRYGVRIPTSFGTSSGGWRRPEPSTPTRGGWAWTAPWDWGSWENTHLRRYLRRGALMMQEVSDILDSAIPLDRFAEIALSSDSIPRQIRQDLVIAAWVRAVLLDDQKRAYDLALQVARAVPETGADMARFRAASPGDRKFVAIGIVLKFPGMSARVYPGNGRHVPLNEMHLKGFNWWWWPRPGEVEPTPPEAGPVDWLTAAERARAKAEWNRIVGLGSGAEWLYRTVRNECEKSQTPPGCPEAVYRAAVSEAWIDYHHGMMYVPLDVQSAAGREGVDLLRRRWPHTRWAQLIERDRAMASTVWQHEYYDFNLSAPYPR